VDSEETTRTHSPVALDAWIVLFGFYHHFLVASHDHVRLQPASAWGTTFVLTAYGLLITEAIGAYVGISSGLLEGLRAKSSKPERCILRWDRVLGYSTVVLYSTTVL